MPSRRGFPVAAHEFAPPPYYVRIQASDVMPRHGPRRLAKALNRFVEILVRLCRGDAPGEHRDPGGPMLGKGDYLTHGMPPDARGAAVATRAF
jgi:hypothetical protein